MTVEMQRPLQDYNFMYRVHVFGFHLLIVGVSAASIYFLHIKPSYPRRIKPWVFHFIIFAKKYTAVRLYQSTVLIYYHEKCRFVDKHGIGKIFCNIISKIYQYPYHYLQLLYTQIKKEFYDDV